MNDSSSVTNNDILAALAAVIEQRKQSGDADSSYVASLHAKGLDKILEKIGEEATEVIIAAKNAHKAGNKEQDNTENTLDALVGETADLWFHSLVMLSQFNIDAGPVLAELARRFGVSGIEEKAQRK